MERESFYMVNLHGCNYGSKFRWTCRICRQMITMNDFADGLCYACDRMVDDSICTFMIHKSCTNYTPWHIENHPFHPQHLLFLSYHSRDFHCLCNACGDIISDCFVYKCSSDQCFFNLDVKCAFLTPTKGKNEIELSCVADDQRGDLQVHPHRLITCSKSENFTYSCTCCKLPFIHDQGTEEARSARASMGTLLVCLDCKALLHKSCAEIPWTIEQHPFHPSHPLVLLPSVVEFRCNLCSQDKSECFAYHCPECDIYLDVSCALLKPKRKNDDHDDFQNNNNVQQLSHSHPLIVCEVENKTFPHTCYKCGFCRRPFRDVDMIYFCPECECLLDKPCTDLPLQIKHVLHREHELALVHDGLEFICLACERPNGRFFSYGCNKCEFYLDLECAMLKHTVLTSRIHCHPLLLCEAESGRSCYGCRQNCHTPFFRCIRQDFVIHVQCIKPLPTKLKSRHCHSLTLTYSPMKDRSGGYDDEEFYCDACELKRLLEDPSYYCEFCGYIAHLHCVIIEILEKSWSSKLRCGDLNELEATFEDFKDSFTSGEKMEVESVLQSYEDMDYSIRIPQPQSCASKEITLKYKVLRYNWANWDAKSKVIEVDTGLWTLEEFAPVLTALLGKHGDFCCYSNLSPKPKMFFVTTVCEVMHNMSITNVIDVTTSQLLTWFQGLALGLCAGLDVAFASNHCWRVANAHFGLHASLFIDRNCHGVGDDEVAERRAIVLNSQEPTIEVRDYLLSFGKSKLRDEINDLGDEVNDLEVEKKKLEKTLEEKRFLYGWKKDCLAHNLELVGERAGKELLES